MFLKKMFRLVLPIFCIIASTSPLFAQSASWYDGKWPHERSNLIPSPQTSFYRLPNGFRYAVIPNKEPAGRVTMYLDVQVGSLMEQDSQLGYAHFVEHMAFNGSRNFPAGSLIPFFQRNGMGFGNDTNAHTSLLETVYKLNLANTDGASLRAGLSVLRDFADGLLFDPAEVRDKIGVILAEEFARNSEVFQAGKKRRQILYNGTRFIYDTIGSREVVAQATAPALKEFYDAWYQPERMVLVVVGPVTPLEIQPLVEEAFTSLEGRKNKVTAPAWGTIQAEGVRAFVDSRPITSTTVSLTVQHPSRHEPDSRSVSLQLLQDELAGYLMHQRLMEKGEEDAGLWVAANYSGRWRNGLTPSATLSATAGEKGWEAALAELEAQLRTVLAFGFTTGEVAHAKDVLRQRLERAVKQEGSKKHDDIAKEFVAITNADRVYTSAAQDLDLYHQLEAELTPEAVNNSIKQAFSPSNRTLYLSGKIESALTGQQVLSAWQKAQAKAVSPYVPAGEARFPYLPDPSATISFPQLTTRVLGEGAPVLHSATWNGGGRLFVLPSSLRKKQVTLQLVFGSGTLALPDEQVDTARMAEAVLAESGLGQLTRTAVKRKLAPLGITVGETFGANANVITASGNSEHLPLLLETIRTQYLDPVVRESARKKVLQQLEQARAKQERTVEGVAQEEESSLFYGKARRFLPLTLHHGKGVTIEEMRRLIEATRSAGPLQLIVSGDIDPQQVVNVATPIFDSVNVAEKKPRMAVKPVFPGHKTVELQVQDKVAKASLAFAFARPLPNVQERGTLAVRQLTAAVVRDHMRKALREKLGATYSPNVTYRLQAEDDGYGLYLIAVGTDAKQRGVVRNAVQEELGKLASVGVTQADLDRLLAPMLTSWTTARKQPEIWTRLLLQELLQGYPYVEWNNNLAKEWKAVDVSAVNAELREAFLASQPALVEIFSTGQENE